MVVNFKKRQWDSPSGMLPLINGGPYLDSGFMHRFLRVGDIYGCQFTLMYITTLMLSFRLMFTKGQVRTWGLYNRNGIEYSFSTMSRSLLSEKERLAEVLYSSTGKSRTLLFTL